MNSEHDLLVHKTRTASTAYMRSGFCAGNVVKIIDAVLTALCRLAVKLFGDSFLKPVGFPESKFADIRLRLLVLHMHICHNMPEVVQLFYVVNQQPGRLEAKLQSSVLLADAC